ncbi:MAG TPA: hypothetical protein VJ891_19855 [Casimicrobiaceae bacterium]|nr:hypothetical protein [Casimicrobiaceae bacterium]
MTSMLIWQTPSIDNVRVSAIARSAIGPAECLRRADGRGTIILCEQGSAPKGVAETHVTRVLSSGETTSDAGRYLFYVIITAPREWRDELCDWYRTEHGPILLECPQWRGFTLYESAAGNGCRLHVLHRIADRTALDSEERKRSRATAWFERLARNAWFDGPFERILAERVNLLERATQ